MIDKLARQLFNDINEKVSQATSGDTPSASQIKVIIEGALRRLQLVTREEFDTQTAVLQRTREKVDALEKQLSEIEKSLQNK